MVPAQISYRIKNASAIAKIRDVLAPYRDVFSVEPGDNNECVVITFDNAGLAEDAIRELVESSDAAVERE